jgi:hypothetical protein
LENRAHRATLFWGANQTFEKLGLARLASMSFRRRSVWIAWLRPKPKVLELVIAALSAPLAAREYRSGK